MRNACVYLFLLIALSSPRLIAQTGRTAADLLPASTQGIVRIVDMPRLQERWEKTQLAKLAEDEGLKAFWEDQRLEIESRLADAGWQLNVEGKDLTKIAAGEAVMAWISRPEDRRKPYALALAVDVKGKKAETDALLAQIERQLKGKGATSKTVPAGDLSITQYTMPRKPGELLLRETFFIVSQDYLLACDDLATLQKMVSHQTGTLENVLSQDVDFKKGFDHLHGRLESGEIEYFVRPIGFGRVLRDVANKRDSRKADILQILESQGFNSFRAVFGRLEIGGEKFDMLHQGFVLADKPLPGSAGLVNTPNECVWELPNWITSNVSSMVKVNWNIQEAFWKSEKLVDAMADQEGVFREFLDGLKENATGPKVDIVEEVLPHLTNDIISVSDCQEPITVDSKRTLVALRVTESDNLAKVIDRVMSNEPTATGVEFEGQKIWRVAELEEGGEELAVSEDFGEFGAPSPKKPEQQDEGPLLETFAITVYGDYLLFSTHVEMIEETIVQSKKSEPSPLEKDSEYQRVREVLDQMRGDRKGCAWQVLRSDLSYRMQYELFRSGQLRQSQSMAASLLERLAQPNKERRGKEKQKIDGSKLPPFDEIRKYLQPAGLFIESVDDGWIYTGFLLQAPSA